MKHQGKVEIRRYRRFVGWDYGGKGASLFITIATAMRRPVFGRVIGESVELSPLGRIVRQSLEEIPARNPGISLFGRVVMPDHIHFNVHVAKGLDEPLKILGEAIRRFKVFTTKQAKLMGTMSGQSPDIATPSHEGRVPSCPLWQQGYHDRLCLCREFIEATERYIAYNPLKWELMYGAGRRTRIIEPLEAPCLDPGDYWKGVGNTALLGERLVALRVSREVDAPAQVSAMLERLSRAVDKGYVILSGFVSPGEKRVRDMLCENKAARFIRLLPTCLPNARYKPESRYVAPLAEGRYLEIARGNDDVGFDRTVCLDYNREIVEMAHTTDGIALYWKADGPHRL